MWPIMLTITSISKLKNSWRLQAVSLL